MTTTTNYGYNVIDGSDQVNIQTQIAPNFTAIDSDLKDVSDAAITTATHTLAGTVHQLVRDDADRAVIRFIATADMATGDTFTVDGVSVTARLVNGEALQTGSFKINNCVECVLVGSVLNVNAVNPTVSAASDISYDNTGSGLTAADVQDAIDEVDAKADLNSNKITIAETVNNFPVGTALWQANADTNTNTTYPYVASISSALYSATSAPMWQLNGVGILPTSAEITEIAKVPEAIFNTSGVTLYATEQPNTALVLEVKGV